MSIQDDLFELFRTPVYKYKGVPINVFFLPAFGKYKKASVKKALYRLENNNYVIFNGSHYKLNENGEKYITKRAAKLKLFSSPFKQEAIKNLLVLFDIPEERKAEREWLRFHLRKFGYKMIQRSVWVGPSPLPKEFTNYLKRIKLADCIKTFKLEKGYQNK